jgi:hypothetical protein
MKMVMLVTVLMVVMVIIVMIVVIMVVMVVIMMVMVFVMVLVMILVMVRVMGAGNRGVVDGTGDFVGVVPELVLVLEMLLSRSVSVLTCKYFANGVQNKKFVFSQLH